jgi:hypothetical protein
VAKKTRPRLSSAPEHGILRRRLERARQQLGCSLDDLTVLGHRVDPYRLDTPAGHRDGQWVATHFQRLITSGRTHWRGLHYALVAHGRIRKPDGAIYRNTDDDWKWLSEDAGKHARWLGYIPFNAIRDQRNAAPIINREPRIDPTAEVGLEIELPSDDDLRPRPIPEGFEPRQAYTFVIFGEKVSLEDVTKPIAERNEADLYLMTGEISDTYVYQIAEDASLDGRPLVVFTLSDCDPAGYQMPVSIGRKLQAFRDLRFPGLKFEIVPVALTVQQVQELDLPSTPLKETERRADRWREAFGVEQTEIDALATLQPETLSEILERAFDPYLDRTLEERVEEAQAEWMEQAEAAINDELSTEFETLHRELVAKLDELRQTIARINEQASLPDIEVPEPEIVDEPREALVSFDDGWIAATRAMIRRKQYEPE